MVFWRRRLWRRKRLRGLWRVFSPFWVVCGDGGVFGRVLSAVSRQLSQCFSQKSIAHHRIRVLVLMLEIPSSISIPGTMLTGVRKTPVSGTRLGRVETRFQPLAVDPASRLLERLPFARLPSCQLPSCPDAPGYDLSHIELRPIALSRTTRLIDRTKIANNTTVYCVATPDKTTLFIPLIRVIVRFDATPTCSLQPPDHGLFVAH